MVSFLVGARDSFSSQDVDCIYGLSSLLSSQQWTFFSGGIKRPQLITDHAGAEIKNYRTCASAPSHTDTFTSLSKPTHVVSEHSTLLGLYTIYVEPLHTNYVRADLLFLFCCCCDSSYNPQQFFLKHTQAKVCS